MNILNYETNKLNNVYYKGEKYIVILWGEYQKWLPAPYVLYIIKVVRTFVQNKKKIPPKCEPLASFLLAVPFFIRVISNHKHNK